MTDVVYLHTTAALALWDYSEASVRKIFGDNTGNADAEKIAVALLAAPNGLDFGSIHRVFSGHASSERLRKAVDDLVRAGRAEITIEKTDGADRKIVREIKAI